MYPEKSLASWLGKAVDPEAKLPALRLEPLNSHLLKPGADTLRDMNALTPDQHEGSEFEELIRRLRLQLGV